MPSGPYLVAGLARAGRAAARALADRAGPQQVTAWDASCSAWIAGGQRSLASRGIRTQTGGDGRKLLGADGGPACLVKSPGIPLHTPLLQAAAAAGLEVIDEAELGWRLDPRPFVGVTGTNGKSTVCALVAAILRRSGSTPVVAGNTFDGPPLSEAPTHPGDVVVAELSSFQLESSPALLPDAAVFTNLSDDHHAYHGGPAAYAAAKRRLFVRGDRSVALAAVNVDDPEGAATAEAVEERGGEVVRFGRGSAAAVRLVDARWTAREGEVSLLIGDERVGLSTRLPGPHNASNVAAALAFGTGLSIDVETCAEAIEGCAPVPGRLEPVVEGRAPFEVLVDYAHNPGGVRAVAETIRGTACRRAIAVVSALAGFTDEAQRRATGRELAAFDVVVVSLERKSPAESRTDPPSGLLEGIREGGIAPVVIPDRRAAIVHAVEQAAPGDSVVLMGRGSLSVPMLDEHDRPYLARDVDLAREALREAVAH